jgi:hypothetical protein
VLFGLSIVSSLTDILQNEEDDMITVIVKVKEGKMEPGMDVKTCDEIIYSSLPCTSTVQGLPVGGSFELLTL